MKFRITSNTFCNLSKILFFYSIKMASFLSNYQSYPYFASNPLRLYHLVIYNFSALYFVIKLNICSSRSSSPYRREVYGAAALASHPTPTHGIPDLDPVGILPDSYPVAVSPRWTDSVSPMSESKSELASPDIHRHNIVVNNIIIFFPSFLWETHSDTLSLKDFKG